MKKKTTIYGLFAALMLVAALIAPGLYTQPTPTIAKAILSDAQRVMVEQPSDSPGKLAQAVTPGLRVEGVSLVDTANQRFVIAGVNMEMYRDYDNGCGWVTDGTYAIRGVMADKVKALGVNAVRLNFSYRFLDTGNLTRFLDMAQELTLRGIYVMPSDHTYTGDGLANASASYLTMTKIIEGMRARGLESYLIMNPWNEPGPDISVADWVQAQKNVLIHLRTTMSFSGVVVLDGIGWSTMLDVAAFRQVLDFDAYLRGGAPNLLFSNHLYPNIKQLPAQIWTAARQVPLVIGELGQENPGVSPLDPAYVRNVISGFLNTGMANGQNGLFAWIYAWCDSNNMLQDWTDPAIPYSARSPLTSHGTLWRDNYYSKLPGQPPIATAAPTVIVERPTNTATATQTRASTATPTRSIVPTNSPRPRSPTPSRTAPPVTITTNTPEPSMTPLVTGAPTRTPSGLESWHVLGKIGGWDVDFWIERVR